MTWLVADQLGTMTLVLDGAGAVVADQRYWPYGAVRAGGIAQTDRLYTGQRQAAADQALGLYRARYYSTLMGRFVSADSAGDGLNRYAYVHDNPLRFVDPSGKCFVGPDGKMLPCDADAVNSWLSCALGGCDSWPELELMARVGIGESAFWSSVSRLFYDLPPGPGQRWDFFGRVVGSIAHHATAWTFGVLPSTAFDTLADFAGIPKQAAPWFRDSLHDLLFGGNATDTTPSNNLPGASDWWDTLYVPLKSHGVDFSWDRINHKQAVLVSRTWDLAQALYAGGGVRAVETQQWSYLQWQIVVNLAGVQAPDLSDACIEDPECWRAYFKGVENPDASDPILGPQPPVP